MSNDPANDQLRLAAYEGHYMGPGNGGIDDLLAQLNFVPIPSLVNGGQPYCEDFNEQMLCGASTNINGCQASPPAGIPGTTNQTTCGNGVREAYEDCDQGLSNGPPPATCSEACRNN